MNRKEIVDSIKSLFKNPSTMIWYDRPSKAIVAKVFYGDDNENGFKTKEDVNQFFKKVSGLFNKIGEDFKEDSITFLQNNGSYADMVFRFRKPQDDLFTTNILDVYEDCDLDPVYNDSFLIGEELVVEREKVGVFFDIMFSHVPTTERRAIIKETFGVS